MSIDWSKKPEDATHYFCRDKSWRAHWYKTGFYCLIGSEADGWKKNYCPLPISRYEEVDAREKAIYSMLEIICSSDLKGRGVTCQLNALYDAGYRKQ